MLVRALGPTHAFAHAHVTVLRPAAKPDVRIAADSQDPGIAWHEIVRAASGGKLGGCRAMIQIRVRVHVKTRAGGRSKVLKFRRERQRVEAAVYSVEGAG